MSAPDNQPFEFNLDSYVKGLDLQDFRFHWNDRRWTFTHVDALDSWVMAAIGDGDPLRVFEEAMGSEQFAEFRALPLPQGGLKELFNRYLKHCGVDPGELHGSTGS
jgi:hypothetical protein